MVAVVSTFGGRIDELIEAVGSGTLRIRVEVDQVYARYQHERIDLLHPRGGQDHYLTDPWFKDMPEHMRMLASNVITDNGSRLTYGASRVAEAGSVAVFTHAPVEYGPLRDSGHPSVLDDGRVVYDRPPVVARLSDDELDDLRHGGPDGKGTASLVPNARQRGEQRP